MMVGIDALAWPRFANHTKDGQARQGLVVESIHHKANTSSSSYLFYKLQRKRYG